MGKERSNPGVNLCALTIAGSDSGAGAGIQADLKTFSALGVYGTSVITLITAQNTLAVEQVETLPVQLLEAQLEAVFGDFEVGAAKTGALGNERIIRGLAAFLKKRQPRVLLVVDPVMISKHGHSLLDPEAVSSLKADLLPLATIVTPNLSEAAALGGMPPITDRDAMLAAAQRIAAFGCQAVVVKGGHSVGEPVDLLWEQGGARWFEGERVNTPHLHGTGCTFSAAITAGLVKGLPLAEAVGEAKEYITGALRHAQVFGHGINPVNHFWQTSPYFGRRPTRGRR